MDEQVLPLLDTNRPLRVEGLDGVRRRDGHQPRAQLWLVAPDGQAVAPQFVAELGHPQTQHGRRGVVRPLPVPLETRERVVDATRRPAEGPRHFFRHFLRQGVDVGPHVVLRPQPRQVDGLDAPSSTNCSASARQGVGFAGDRRPIMAFVSDDSGLRRCIGCEIRARHGRDASDWIPEVLLRSGITQTALSVSPAGR